MVRHRTDVSVDGFEIYAKYHGTSDDRYLGALRVVRKSDRQILFPLSWPTDRTATPTEAREAALECGFPIIVISNGRSHVYGHWRDIATVISSGGSVARLPASAYPFSQENIVPTIRLLRKGMTMPNEGVTKPPLLTTTSQQTALAASLASHPHH